MQRDEHLDSLIERLHECGVSDKELLKFNSLRNQTNRALEYVHFDQEDRQLVDDLLTLVDALTSFSDLMDANKIALLAAGYVSYFMGADEYSFWEWKQSQGIFVTQTSSGIFGKQNQKQNGNPAETLFIQSVLDSVFQKKEMQQILINDPELSSEARRTLDDLGVSAMLALPVEVDVGPMGVILICDMNRAYAFPEYQLFIAQLLANYAGVAISRAQVYDAFQRRIVELETLRQASLTLTASLDLQNVLDTILEHTLRIIHRAQDAHIFLFEDDTLKFMSALWADGNKGRAWANPRPNGLTYQVARRGELIRVDDIREHPIYESAPGEWSGSIIGLPLKIADQVVGVMTVAHPDKFAFSKDEIRILRLLGDQAAVAIENARLHSIVNQQARTDALTGLPNRRALDERMRNELRRSQRYQRSFSIIMLDLDGFKEINDQYGHPQGDTVLKKVAQHMQATIRDTDYLARYGGDEFALLLPETDVETASKMALRLQNEVSTFRIEFEQAMGVSMGVSFGCATYPDHGDDIDHLLSVADNELYQHKDVRQK